MRPGSSLASPPVLLAALALALGGCSPTVGTECDEDAARTPYFRAGDGAPAYPGQALLLDYCQSCHNDPGGFGAPQGLEMDANIVTLGGAEGVEQARRLLARQATIHRNRDAIYGQVVGGTMPPRGFADAPPTYADADGDPLPGIRTPEAHAMLRNWLACGSPVVERTAPLAQPCSANVDCAVTNFCDLATGQCVGVGDVVPPQGSIDCMTPEPTWSWIYPCVVQTSCAGAACHVGGSAGGLSMPSIGEAHAALVNMGPSTAAMGGACEGQEPYVVPGDADNSLLVHKIEGMDETGAMVCGNRMPIGPALSTEQIDTIRMWIDMGAMPAM